MQAPPLGPYASSPAPSDGNGWRQPWHSAYGGFVDPTSRRDREGNGYRASSPEGEAAAGERRSRRARRTSRSERSERSRETQPTPRSPRANGRDWNGRRNGNGRKEARQWRYYLTTEDPVVDAPTIGPRMAARLHEVGIRTVADLLAADATQLSTQLGLRRVTAADVRSWQRQAELVCRVPNLRGHDAQILVACGIESVDQLATHDADRLWGRVEPFAQSAEAKRLLRGGNGPDRAEVSDWVTWAQHAQAGQSV